MSAEDMCPNCVTPWKCNGPHNPSVETMTGGQSADYDADRNDKGHHDWCPLNGCRCHKCGPCMGPPLCVIPPVKGKP